jgi:rhodanese-related sulfurtransferase
MRSSLDPASLDVTPEQTQAALADDTAQVIDGALHIELQHLASSAGKVDTDRPVIFHCRLGARSAMAARAFRGLGVDAYSMAGGLQRWADEGRPMIPEGAMVADH